MKRTILALTAAVALTACGSKPFHPTHGTVVSKRVVAPYTDAQHCTKSNGTTRCTGGAMHPQAWYLRLSQDGKQGDLQVSLDQFNTYDIGQTYPR